MSTKNTSALIIRNSLIGLLALALLVVWYCLVTPRYIAPPERSQTCLYLVIVTSFLSSLFVTVRRFESRTWKHYLIAATVGFAVTAIVFVAFMMILLNTVGG